MNFELAEQQKSIQEAARKFAQEELLPDVLERDEKSEFPVEQFHKVGELGFIGLPYPKEYGGQGLGYMEYALAVEEVSKVDVSFGIAFSVTTSLYAGSVWNSDATEEQKKALFPITYRPFSCIRSKHKIRHNESNNNDCFYFIMSDFILQMNKRLSYCSMA